MNKFRILSIAFLSFLFLGIGGCVFAGGPKKREFRGAWIQCVNGQFQNIGTARMQQMLTQQLDALQKDGVNAIIFQVRAECDALYPSSYEPWSKFLTGQQGTPPSPYWDPLQWMVEQCHKRGMELHAWINPYRAKTKTTTRLAQNHIAVTHPERVFSYDGLYVLNPGIAENRDYIYKIAEDIVRRYDIDGFHIDDYFYPYPVAGQTIPDQKEFQEHGHLFKNIGDWRRDNVSVFIKQLGDAIHGVKPWVKFGVSPFGIYRNAKSAPGVGSRTNGLQNYDDLYADVIQWVNNGWVDYCVPQIYWEIGNKAADYKELIGWWNNHAGNRPLYIGEDVLRTVKNVDPQNPRSHQLPAKRRLHGQAENVSGTVLWYSSSVVQNPGNYETLLRTNYWRYPALQPSMPFIDGQPPRKPKSVKARWTSDGYCLTWKAPKGEGWQDAPYKYVVYCFAQGAPVNLDDASKIVAITSEPMVRLNYRDGNDRYTFVVTTLDRMSNESTGKKKKVKL
ncbi:glycoside hydrolase family 10 protein [Prevotella dentasini]|uniref:glycoside hydrolase family 10 protein n=1 Tax=Prevotella dentasini TaxID=589537 RepID=UPI0004699254|nr:family 10 glycosylhydrolase [Prevotella dentasini]